MKLSLRHQVRETDRDAVLTIVRSTGYFNEAELAVAVELVDDHLARGEVSGYRFLFAENAGSLVGYTCYGPIAGTKSSWDLYWIAVHADRRGEGIGGRLLAVTLECIGRAGGSRVYAETSSRERYEPTRRFYETNGFSQASLLEDFYAPGDAKLIYLRRMTVK